MHRRRELTDHRLGRQSLAQLRRIDEERAGFELDRPGLAPGASHRLPNRGDRRVDVDPEPAVELDHGPAAVIGRQGHDDPGRVADRKEGVEKPAEEPVEPEDLIVLLP